METALHLHLVFHIGLKLVDKFSCHLHPAMMGEVIVTSGEATTSQPTNDRNSVVSISPTLS